MNDLKIQGLILLLISTVCIPIGWYAMLVSDNLFVSMLGVIVFAGGVGAFAFAYIFIRFSVLEGR